MSSQGVHAPVIPFNAPFLAGRELEYVSAAITDGNIASDGPWTERCVSQLRNRLGLKEVLLTPSCTAALEMAALLCGLKPGDEVIMPSFTFVTTASAFVRAGATPVFVDIREDTCNLDEDLLEAAISERTRAVVPVHYGGVGCEMDSIMAIARRHGLLVVEDAAQAVHAHYRGQALGSIGDLGCYSFHDTKNYVCGEGGALCVNNAALVERAEILREKGTNRSQFIRGQVDKYTWVDTGSSFLPSELACAYLAAQLEQLDQIRDLRGAAYMRYLDGLQPLAERGLLTLPVVPDGCTPNYHNLAITVGDRAERDALLDHLRREDIMATFHYIPLHSSPMGRRLGNAVHLPVTDSVSSRLVRLPLYCGLADEGVDRVVAAVRTFFRA